jgi:hypothetical protein
MTTGCGSGAATHSTTDAATAPAPAPAPGAALAEIKASGEQIASDIEASMFQRACEGFTKAALAKLAEFPQGCAGALELAHAGSHTGARAFGKLFRHALLTRLAHFKIRGSEALYNGVVEARYEEGRWRIEGQGGAVDGHST